MALPVIPIAVAAGAFALARNITITPADQRAEDHLDDLAEGLGVHRPNPDQINMSYRHKSTIRWGNTGPAYELDLSLLSRIRLRKIQ